MRCADGGRWSAVRVALVMGAVFAAGAGETVADMFSSTAKLEALLETQQGVMRVLHTSIRYTMELLDFLNSTLVELKNHHEISTKDVSKYISNPINAFSLLKRLSVDLKEVDKRRSLAIEKISNASLYMKEYQYPKLKDLDGAVDALVRLQETYRLDVTDLASGKLNGVQYSFPMSMDDCYQIGVSLFEFDDYYYANQWLTQTLSRWDPKTDSVETKIAVMEYLDYCNYKLGELDKAFHWTKEILKIEPGHNRSQINMRLFEKLIRKTKFVDEHSKREDASYRYRRHNDNLQTAEREQYEALCRGRGEYEPAPALLKNTKCYYKFGKNAFLRLAPLKVEEKYVNPNLYIFHDVMSETEIAVLKNLALPKLKRASVQRNSTHTVPADYRISDSAWLADAESRVVAAVSRRVRHMTDLSTDTAELLQVANYGIGGHYDPHYDIATGDKAPVKKNGQRIATILFYLSEVEEGGGTAFLGPNVTVFPARGSAAYWRNLHPCGAPDMRTKHAACPVLLGSKWVANKWLHEVGQELLASCDLHQHQERHVREFSAPELRH